MQSYKINNKPNNVDIFLFYHSDISQLAKAAVSGDESALDMFNWKKSGKNRTTIDNSF
jgi:hypothetical protein